MIQTKPFRKLVFVSLILFLIFDHVAAQDLSTLSLNLNAKHFSSEPFIPPIVTFQELSTDDTLFIKKRFWRASGELMLAQIVPWAYNYYVRDAEFAHITWESIGHNLKFSSWEWDDNSFNTNQFAHPYHGSLYYSAFRSNGYSFWQSVPAAFAGSYIWEVFGETHPPAQNDFINTSLGGISLGEMTFRFSNLIVNNRQTGFKRQVNEVLAFLVNPMNGLNRIIDGRWGRYMVNSPDRVPGYLSGNLDVGYRRISTEIDNLFTEGDNEFFARATIQYGNPFEDFDKPFSNFALAGELGASDSATLNNLQVNGFLWGKHIEENDHVHHVLTANMNYDYIKNTSIQYGGQSFSLKFLSDHIYDHNSNLYTEVGIIGVAIAAVPDDYLLYGEGRNYDYGPGGGVQLGGKLDLRDKFWLSINYKGIWFYTVNGNESHFFLNTISSDIRYFLSPQFSLAVQSGYFVQNSFYADFENTVKKYPYGRIAVGYTIGNH